MKKHESAAVHERSDCPSRIVPSLRKRVVPTLRKWIVPHLRKPGARVVPRLRNSILEVAQDCRSLKDDDCPTLKETVCPSIKVQRAIVAPLR